MSLINSIKLYRKDYKRKNVRFKIELSSRFKGKLINLEIRSKIYFLILNKKNN